ncbi:MAG: aminotransferase class V-fold PLP-dependent enzyme [Gammaproteobacteria bacterium]|nr:aminotransferase class V-fold PLP-dependent enzyme [Gammaproteobacteria bacterium]
MNARSGRHFLQIPGPSNVPDRVLRAIDSPTIDHRGPEFAALGRRVLEKIRGVFKTTRPVLIYPSSGTGGWEAAMVNTLNPGDRVLMYETGHFAALWREAAGRLGLRAEVIEGEWGRAVDPDRVAARLTADRDHQIKAVCVVHNETSTAVTSRIDAVRAALDATDHPALLMVDTISSLGSIDYRHDEWGVDVSIGGSQKGLMLPPGLAFNAVSDKALAAHRKATLPNAYWNWSAMLGPNQDGFFPYTPATNLLYGLETALDMLYEEGLSQVFARHERFAAAARLAVQTWGLPLMCTDPDAHSPVLTAARMPEGHDADRFRQIVLERFDMSLGAGLSKVAGKVFRIGHLGHLNELSLMGTLAGVEMGLTLAGVPHHGGGVQIAMQSLTGPQADDRAAVAADGRAVA